MDAASPRNSGTHLTPGCLVRPLCGCMRTVASPSVCPTTSAPRDTPSLWVPVIVDTPPTRMALRAISFVSYLSELSRAILASYLAKEYPTYPRAKTPPAGAEASAPIVGRRESARGSSLSPEEWDMVRELSAPENELTTRINGAGQTTGPRPHTSGPSRNRRSELSHADRGSTPHGSTTLTLLDDAIIREYEPGDHAPGTRVTVHRRRSVSGSGLGAQRSPAAQSGESHRHRCE